MYLVSLNRMKLIVGILMIILAMQMVEAGISTMFVKFEHAEAQVDKAQCTRYQSAE